MTTTRREVLFQAMFYIFWLALVYFATSNTGSWLNWDAHWYQKVWFEGYPRFDPRDLVFPPGFSFLVGTISKLARLDFMLVAALINCCSYFFVCHLVAELFYRRFLIPRLGSFIFTLSLPPAYFAFTAYSDTVFGLLLWLLLWLETQPVCTHGGIGHREGIGHAGGIGHANDLRRRFIPGGGFAIDRRLAMGAIFLAAPWIRLTGYAFGAWILLRRWQAAFVLVSLAGWLALNWIIAGDPLYFLRAQKLFLMSEGTLLDGMSSSFGGVLHTPAFSWRSLSWPTFAPYLEFNFLPCVYFVLLVATGLWLLLKREWAFAVTLISVLAISHNQPFWRSVVRYDWPLLPMLLLPLSGWLRIHSSVARGRAVLGECLRGVTDTHAVTDTPRTGGQGSDKARSRAKLLYIVAWSCIAVVTAIQFILQVRLALLFKSGAWAF